MSEGLNMPFFRARARDLRALLRGALTRRLAAEEGSFLVEVAVTAVIVVVVALGTFAAFDGATASSAAIKSRAVAAGLAQQDQERMRAFKAVDLSNYQETRTQTVAGVNYTVTSRADWVTDSSGSASCTASARADYLRVNSTVTWTAMRSVQPVQMTSLIAPPNGSFGPNQGSLAVQVADPAGNPQSGVTVNVTGPASFSATTNAAGCVLWGYITAGNYTATLGGVSCIDHQGISPPSRAASVVGSATTTLTLECGNPGQIAATFTTKVLSGTVQASNARWLSIGNSGLDAPGIRTFGDGTAQATLTATAVYPFTNPYSVFSGNCTGSDPALYPLATPGNPDYRNMVTVAAGGSYNVSIRQPAVNVLVVNSSNVALANANVRATITTAGCSWTIGLGPTNSSGQVPDPGLPYGTYTLCADNGTRKVTTIGVKNENPNGTAQVKLTIPASGSSGTCP